MKKPEELFEPVDPKSSLVGKVYPDDTPLSPKRLDFSAYGFEDDDFIGLAKTGKYYYKWPERLTADNLHVKFGSDPSEGLSVEQEIYRLSNGVVAKFAPNDVYFKDNKSKGKFGVVISFVNNPKPRMKSGKLLSSDNSFEELKLGDDVKLVGGDDILLSDFTSDSPAVLFKNKSKGDYLFQYRGWYENNVWIPKYSTYEGRPGKKHAGIDIFAPVGTEIISPIDGFFEPGNGKDFGTYGVITFEHNKKKKFLFLCHLSKLELKSKQKIFKGMTIGYSGCSGNAKKGGLPCGSPSKRNRFGGRSDHVHIEVRVGSYKDGSPTDDPVKIFNWSGKIKYG
ncbi:MAG: M23 family metallopeptidase [Hyphomicrobiales bacterium]|nr:M23 family metallopeptidase [Hyphomicrobiales bacterium]